MTGATQRPPALAGPAFDEIAEAAAEHRHRIGQPELTDEEADALALDETKAARRTRRQRRAGVGARGEAATDRTAGRRHPVDLAVLPLRYDQRNSHHERWITSLRAGRPNPDPLVGGPRWCPRQDSNLRHPL